MPSPTPAQTPAQTPAPAPSPTGDESAPRPFPRPIARPPSLPPPGHPPIETPRIGVLLVNLGTPEAPTRSAVARYLAEFLSDRRVVELPALLWQPLLRGVIVPLRAGRSAHAYRAIWTEKGSPLAVITAAQAQTLSDLFGQNVIVDHAMRYGTPAIADRIHALHDEGCDRILIAPLYPQYSGATTATVLDAAYRTLATLRWQPAVRTLPPYYDDPVYVAALAQHVRDSLAALDFEPELLLASFHGMPRRTLDKGDPYHCHCQKTARLLAEALDRPVSIAFQSRFGREQWLEPSTEAELKRLAGSGVRRLAVVTPGFAADNLETLEEIALRGRDVFLEAGGTGFAALPCLNAGEVGITMLKTLLSRQLAGWLRDF